MASEETPSFIFLGRLNRDFIILPSHKAYVDQPGGNALYATIGLLVWQPDLIPGIVARVGEDYPQAWLDRFENEGIDVRSVHILPEAIDVRRFTAYIDLNECVNDDPIMHFARIGKPFPRELLGYVGSPDSIDSRIALTPVSLRTVDIHPDFLNGGAAHLCPLDYLSHSMLPALLRKAAYTTVTLDPSPGYMNPTFWNDVPSIITGLTAFIPSERELRFLFKGHSEDLWEMVEAIGAYGCELVVVKRGQYGQLLYDVASRFRWEIPAYPARVVDPNGAGDAFCGGFLAGYRRTYNPLEAVLYGNISASLVVEGSGPFFALDALPGLTQARLEALRPMVHKV